MASVDVDAVLKVANQFIGDQMSYLEKVWEATREMQQAYVKANPDDLDAAATILPPWEQVKADMKGLLPAVAVTMQGIAQIIDGYWEQMKK